MSDIQIFLEPRKHVYYPGDNVSGYILLNLSKEKKVNKVCLEASGRAHATFWHGHGDDNRCYRSEIIYLKDHLTLWEKNKAKGKKFLPCGSNKYPFSFTIPHDAAPSLKGTHGHIRYRLKAELDLPWALDKHCELDIMVGSSVNLYSSPMYSQPQSACIHKSSAFTPSNSLEATVTIPRLAWMAGEMIPVYCNITNNSSHDLSAIEIKIVRKEVVTGQLSLGHHCKMSHEYIDKILSMRTDVCIPSSTSKQIEVDVRVPASLITITNCPIINITYELIVELHTKGIFSSCPSTCMPIIFSNIPLNQSSHIPTIEFQSSTAIPPPYPSVTPVTGQSTMSQPILYPSAPPPYSLYASNPSLEASTSSSAIPAPEQFRQRFPSAPPLEYEKPSTEVMKL